MTFSPLSLLKRTGVRKLLTFSALGVCLSFFTADFSRATTVIAPSFDSLVKQSDVVVRGTVQSVESEWRIAGGKKFIASKVRVDVHETISGVTPSPLILQMVGGKIGDESLTIEGAPQFEVGKEYILFVRDNGKAFYPLVGIMHGQYPVKTDEKSGRRFVARCNGAPLHGEDEVPLPITNTFTPYNAAAQRADGWPALTPTEFSQRIRASHEKAGTKK